jgi:hypothetical protein
MQVMRGWILSLWCVVFWSAAAVAGAQVEALGVGGGTWIKP